MKQMIRLTEADLSDIVKESVSSILNEYFKSPKLANFAKENGGLKKTYNGGRYDGIASYDEWGRQVPASELTDDMLDDELYDSPHYEEGSIKFNNGKNLRIKDWKGGVNLTNAYKEANKYNQGTSSLDNDYYHSPTDRAFVARNMRRYLGDLNKDAAEDNLNNRSTLGYYDNKNQARLNRNLKIDKVKQGINAQYRDMRSGRPYDDSKWKI